MNKESNEKPQGMEIAFGVVFENTFGGVTTKQVILDIRDSNLFETSNIFEEEGKTVIAMSGTMTLDKVDRILEERLTLAEVIEGVANFFGDTGIPEELIQILKEHSEKPPRFLSK